MTAISLHIGLNRISPTVYGSENQLRGCINDAISMNTLASGLGYVGTVLTDEEATLGALESITAAVAGQLLAGDIFLLTYSGHGSQVIDLNGDEADGLDESWCLYDGKILDDDLHKIWGRFRPGVRIIVVSDCCHSGTLIEKPLHRDIHCAASGILLAGCRDSQLSYDTPANGAFTAQLLKVWNDGNFRGSHRKFCQAISAGLPKRQQPCYLSFGVRNYRFSRQHPFRP